jgi:Xaa-Pro aminopeptidase
MNSAEAILDRVRTYLRSHSLDALIIPSADPHQSEYTQEHEQARSHVTGFSGSAGTAVVTHTHAGLWTDSRYFLEAEHVLDGTPYTLHRLHTPGVTDYPQWIADHLRPGSAIGVDAHVVTIRQVRSLSAVFDAREIELVQSDDPFNEIWIDRPPVKAEPVWALPAAAGSDPIEQKLERIREAVRENGANCHIVSTLDDIAWILNLRGSDVRFNPVFRAYLVIGPDNATLYRDAGTLSDDAAAHLAASRVSVHPYESFFSSIATIRDPVLIDPARTSWAIGGAIRHARTVEALQPSTAFKARKTDTELERLRAAMRRDGVAMVRFLAWLDRTDVIGMHATEWDLAERLREYRSSSDSYIDDSFDYISGFGGNGAIVHYRPTAARSDAIDRDGVYLIDSGAQYIDGTTDITRTVPIGYERDPDSFSDAARDATLVLKGHIALATVSFPYGTAGADIDAVARLALWRRHRTYGHGTGHGVGYVLNVHEGPQRIAPGAERYPLETGMIVSNEPGLYRSDRYGIRIENLLVVREDESTEFGDFLRFETLSLAPIDRRLIDAGLLSHEEREWVDSYHRRVHDEIAPALDETDRAWLGEACAPLLR